MQSGTCKSDDLAVSRLTAACSLRCPGAAHTRKERREEGCFLVWSCLATRREQTATCERRWHGRLWCAALCQPRSCGCGPARRCLLCIRCVHYSRQTGAVSSPPGWSYAGFYTCWSRDGNYSADLLKTIILVQCLESGTLCKKEWLTPYLTRA